MKKITDKILDKKYFIFDIDGTLVDSMGMWNLVDQATIYNQTGQTVSVDDIKIIRDSVLYDPNNIGGDIYNLFYHKILVPSIQNVSLKWTKAAFYAMFSDNFLPPRI